MKMHHFPRPTPQPTPRQIAVALDDFSELLSRDLPLPEIAQRMEITGGTATVLLRLLNEKMGA